MRVPDVLLGRIFDQRPFVAVYVVSDVHLFQVLVEHYVQLVSVVGPRSELQVAELFVEGKVSDVDGAGALEDGGRNPEYPSFVRDDSHCIAMFLQASICATTYISAEDEQIQKKVGGEEAAALQHTKTRRKSNNAFINDE